MNAPFQQKTDLVTAPTPIETLPALIQRAASQLASATNAAEVLEARDGASIVYDAAKKAGRLARAKGAHDELIAKAHRAQADALEIEAQAKRRLADEYDAAQERGEVRTVGNVPEQNNTPTAADIGLTRKDIHEARIIRDAEQANPGIVRRVLDERLEAHQEPTKVALRVAVVEAAMRGLRPQRAPDRRNPLYVKPTPANEAWTHIYGTARAFVEWATIENLSLAEEGLAEKAEKHSQDRHIAIVRECAELFTQIAEGLPNAE